MIVRAGMPIPNYYLDLVITDTNVTIAKGIAQFAVAAATIVRGVSLYVSATGLDLTDADVVGTAKFAGIALSDGAVGQFITYLPSGSINVGAVLTVGVVYVVSTGAGKIAPLADLATGDFLTIIGVATTTSKLTLHSLITGVALP